MQREIKFRARHIKNKRWYYGIETDCKADSFLPLGVFWLWVEFGILDRKTVGESTGLKDKHKIKTYEGDIIRVIEPNEDSCMGATFEYICPVCFGGGDYSASFTVKNEKFWRGFALLYNKRFEIEIIGNRWENPEPLEPSMTSDETAEERSR